MTITSGSSDETQVFVPTVGIKSHIHYLFISNPNVFESFFYTTKLFQLIKCIFLITDEVIQSKTVCILNMEVLKIHTIFAYIKGIITNSRKPY